MLQLELEIPHSGITNAWKMSLEARSLNYVGGVGEVEGCQNS